MIPGSSASRSQIGSDLEDAGRTAGLEDLRDREGIEDLDRALDGVVDHRFAVVFVAVAAAERVAVLPLQMDEEVRHAGRGPAGVRGRFVGYGHGSYSVKRSVQVSIAFFSIGK